MAKSRALVDPTASVRVYLAAEKSDNTRRAYKSDWQSFVDWCEEQDLRPLPAEPLTVAKYLASLADRGIKVSTISRRATAIRYLHKAAGHEPPTNAEGVKAVIRGIRRKKGSRPARKAPAVAAAIAAMLDALPNNLTGKRDRALLLVAFAAALRRSELVALLVEDVDFRAAGIVLTIRRSKTDQEGKGREIAVPRGKRLKPAATLAAWLKAAKIVTGPIFREIDRHGNVGQAALSGRSVARIVKKAAARAGLNPRIFSGHSLRAGFVTSSLNNGVDPLSIMKVTGHQKVDTLNIYDRRERGFREYAGKGIL
jgi:site-specific recombinase XerD